jgi:hypothetical protein
MSYTGAFLLILALEFVGILALTLVTRLDVLL